MDKYTIEDIVKALEEKYDTKVDVSYDLAPMDADGLIDLIEFLLVCEKDGLGGGPVASGEAYVYHVGADIEVLLLKRGVELSFKHPQSEEVN